MFQKRYDLMSLGLIVEVIDISFKFRLEIDIYAYIKRLTQLAGFKYHRIDTVNQQGFPDILLLKNDDYCLIEAKMLKKKKLVSLEDDLEWQFGQIAYAVRAVTLEHDYLLAVGRHNKLALIGQEQTLCRLRKNLTC